jgi:hypothetical protein
MKSKRVNVCVRGDFDKSSRFTLQNVRKVEELWIPPYSINVGELNRKYPYLRRMKMKSIERVVPSMLIVIDNAKLTAHGEIHEGLHNAPIATRQSCDGL